MPPLPHGRRVELWRSMMQSLMPKASSAPTTAPTPDLGPLTPREREVAALVAQGLSNRQIAERLVITERTVAAHMEHILDKLSFSSRTQIGVWAAHHYPIESSPV